MEKKKFYNRQYIVNRKLQLTIILHTLTLATWVCLINFIFSPAIASRLFGIDHARQAVLGLVILFVGLITSLAWATVLTNQIAGPIFRLRSHLESVLEGKTTEPIDFRKLDYFTELVEPYNQLLLRLKKPGDKP